MKSGGFQLFILQKWGGQILKWGGHDPPHFQWWRRPCCHGIITIFVVRGGSRVLYFLSRKDHMFYIYCHWNITCLIVIVIKLSRVIYFTKNFRRYNQSGIINRVRRVGYQYSPRWLLLALCNSMINFYPTLRIGLLYHSMRWIQMLLAFTHLSYCKKEFPFRCWCKFQRTYKSSCQTVGYSIEKDRKKSFKMKRFFCLQVYCKQKNILNK